MLVTLRGKKLYEKESFAFVFTNSSVATICKCLLHDDRIIGTDTTDNM